METKEHFIEITGQIRSIKQRAKLMGQKTISIKLAVHNNETFNSKTIADDINRDLKEQNISICELEDLIAKLEVLLKLGDVHD